MVGSSRLPVCSKILVLLFAAGTLIGLAYVAVISLIPEPGRRKFNAIFVAGAGAAYLSSGALGPWELVFTTAITFCAYKGLTSYRWIGVAWLLHTVLDIIHTLLGKPILPFAPHSSFGCAICDPVIALWCFANGPSLRHLRHRHTETTQKTAPSPSA